MRKIVSALSLALLMSVGNAWADAKADCEKKAVSKDGKPLAGAAKDASVKKCVKDAGGAAAAAAPAGDAKADCEKNALSKDGKPLAGAAKDASVKKCLADAKK
jgi:hypothetical protein